jgi:hypothetical protein
VMLAATTWVAAGAYKAIRMGTPCDE